MLLSTSTSIKWHIGKICFWRLCILGILYDWFIFYFFILETIPSPWQPKKEYTSLCLSYLILNYELKWSDKSVLCNWCFYMFYWHASGIHFESDIHQLQTFSFFILLFQQILRFRNNLCQSYAIFGTAQNCSLCKFWRFLPHTQTSPVKQTVRIEMKNYTESWPSPLPLISILWCSVTVLTLLISSVPHGLLPVLQWATALQWELQCRSSKWKWMQ